ncbi:MAG: hypothetical protein H7343_15775 [Undibacterium sp.]|nr:hypothetical protein [Opitutaceae bacterium]
MATLVIESFPESLRTRLEQTAAAHRRSVPQETIHLLEKALAVTPPIPPVRSGPSYWGTRRVLPSLEAALRSAPSDHSIDSTRIISDERDAR